MARILGIVAILIFNANLIAQTFKARESSASVESSANQQVESSVKQTTKSRTKKTQESTQKTNQFLRRDSSDSSNLRDSSDSRESIKKNSVIPKIAPKKQDSRESRESANQRESIKKDSAPKIQTPKATMPKIKIPKAQQDSRKDSATKRESAPKTSQTPQSKPKSSPQTFGKILEYRRMDIFDIYQKREERVNFFAGLSVGVEFIEGLEIREDAHWNKTKSKSSAVSGSFGVKSGILSEGSVLGGRFYGEFSYMKSPEFNTMILGLDVDLLVNYYEARDWRIGGFVGIGGGMNIALLATKRLNSAGVKPLIAVGWVNLGLVRFIYARNHSFEFIVRIQYAQPTLYSYTNGDTTSTTIKQNSHSMQFSYVYHF